MKSKMKRLFASLQQEGVTKTIKKIAHKIKRRMIVAQPSYTKWIQKYDLDVTMDTSLLQYQPLISILVPTYNTNPVWLKEAVESVKCQSYGNWELCIVDDASTAVDTIATLKKIAQDDERINVKFREKNGHIAKTSNDALAMAKGEWIALLDHDDTLNQNALFWMVEALNQNKNAEMLYSDEDKIDKNGKRSLPFFKPDWSPHLALSQAYLGHLVCIKKSLIEKVGGFNENLNGAQDYDLWLRASIVAHSIVHIPKILYHWRMHTASTALSAESKPYAHHAGKAALNHYLTCKYPNYTMNAIDGEYLFTYKMQFGFERKPLVSIIIPTKDKIELLKPCIESIQKLSTWQNFEIIILDNNSIEKETAEYLQQIASTDNRICVVNAPIEFNWSKLNNLGVHHAKGEFFIFLNNDTVVISKDWIEQMVGFAQLPDVGLVGGLLLFEDNTIQHAGVVVGMSGWADHVFRTCKPCHFIEGFVSPILTRNVLAVTGACTTISKERFVEFGGYDESFIICGSDVELGIRAHKMGFYNVLSTDARLYHLESKTRSPHVPENDFVQSNAKYAPYREALTDPYFNANLSIMHTTPTYHH